ncbi:MAG: hypothetical protein LIP77_08155, partial [Planctomycetes bacterium]|nr:hypothetical protein [Planctomycetota bacterium]
VKMLADPPRLALTDPVGPDPDSDSPLGGSVDLGLPFPFPRDVRIVIRMRTPSENVGDLLLALDVDRNYRPDAGTTTARFGSPTRPGAVLFRAGAPLGENTVFSLTPDTTAELVLERSDNRIRASFDGKLVLDCYDTPTVNPDAGRLTLTVVDGSLEFMDLAIDLRGLSRSGAASLIEQANNLAARGRESAVALGLFENVLLEPTDPQNHLRALRGYARMLWPVLPRSERNVAGIERNCAELNKRLGAAGRANPGEIDFLMGLALTFHPGQEANNQALDRLNRASAVAYSSTVTDYGDLARFESVFVHLRMGSIEEAARLLEIMHEDGTTQRLYERFGDELAGGGQVALLLEKIDPLIQNEENLEIAASLLRGAAAISPYNLQSANHFLRLGRIHASRGAHDEAVDCMHWAERLSPEWFRPYLDEALIHFEANQGPRGREAVERARAAMPQSLDLHLGVARLFLDELPERYRDPVTAESAARTAVALTDNIHPVAWELLARSLERQNRLNEALTAINRSLALETSESRTWIRDQMIMRMRNSR